MIAGYPENCPPTVITVHMPSPFTRSFARRLDGLTGAASRRGRGRRADRGRPRLSRAGHASRISRSPAAPIRAVASAASDLVNGHRPSVDVLFDSTRQGLRRARGRRHPDRHGPRRRRRPAGDAARRRAARSARTRPSSVVYGMPKVAFEIGAVERQLAAWRHARRHPQADVDVERADSCRSLTRFAVMVVDDTSVSRALIVDALDQMGVRGVVIAKDGATALQALTTKPVHLVISDMNMPGLDGLGLLKALAREQADGAHRLHPHHRQRRQDADRARAAVRPQQLHHQAVHGRPAARGDRGGGREVVMSHAAQTRAPNPYRSGRVQGQRRSRRRRFDAARVVRRRRAFAIRWPASAA